MEKEVGVLMIGLGAMGGDLVGLLGAWAVGNKFEKRFRALVSVSCRLAASWTR